MPPAVSLVTICYRNPAELEQTLACAAVLDPALVEVLIVDGSPDDSCARVAARFPAFRHLQGPDSGKYDAMNKGIAAARGDSVLFMNSGDALSDPHQFAAMVRDNRDILASTMVYGDCIKVVNGEHIAVAAPDLSDANLRLGILPSHQSILIPAGFHRRNLYDDALHFAADTKFLKTAFRALPRLHVPMAIGVYAYGGVSTSPGSWRLLARQYREVRDAHELRVFERIRLAGALVRRKLLHALVGEAGLQRLQARRLKRSTAQSA
jgi:glycosyltransferase involved in cell wall biosynthesis